MRRRLFPLLGGDREEEVELLRGEEAGSHCRGGSEIQGPCNGSGGRSVGSLWPNKGLRGPCVCVSVSVRACLHLCCGVSSHLCWGLELPVGVGGQFRRHGGLWGCSDRPAQGQPGPWQTSLVLRREARGCGGELTVVIVEGHLKRGCLG